MQRSAAAAGVAGIALNIVAVVALQPIPHTYKPGHVDRWLTECLAAPTNTTIAAWAFTIGLTALVPFCVGLARRDPGVATGAALIGAGALLDAAGTMLPIAALHAERPIGEALLWATLLLDSSFNALLGLGFLAVAAGMNAAWPRGLRPLAVLAGLTSLPVALQFHSDTFANLLALSGPVWIAWMLWASWILTRPEPC